MSYCKVDGCRFPESHTTRGHKCGYCGSYGHGQIECGNSTKIEDLREYFEEILPIEKWCTYCPSTSTFIKKTHTNEAHNCKNCGKRHGEDQCIIQEFEVYSERFISINEVNRFSKQKFQDAEDDNIYTSVYSGMGSTLYIRKKNGSILSLFMHGDSWGQYGSNLDDRPILNNFIEGLDYVDNINFFRDELLESCSYKCPICRTYNEKSKVVKAFGLEDKCKICLENNVERFFSECGHAVACEECFKSM